MSSGAKSGVVKKKIELMVVVEGGLVGNNEIGRRAERQKKRKQ